MKKLALTLIVAMLAGCAGQGGQAGAPQPVAIPPEQIQAASDYLGQSLTNMTAGYQALLADEQARDPAHAAQIQKQGDALLNNLKLATLSYQAAASSSAQIRADNPQVNSAWLTALDAVSRVAAVVGPYALQAFAGH